MDSRKLFDRISSLEDGLNVSKVKYADIAPFVGLDADQDLYDITTFDLYRSRIPTSLFRSIVQDMDLLLHQYGPPVDHRTEEATSRFLAPVGRTVVLRSLIAWLLNLVLSLEIGQSLSFMAA